MIFKSGDKVVVDKNKIICKREGELFDKYHYVSDMKKYINNIMEIDYGFKNNTGVCYFMRNDSFYWHEDLLLPYKAKKSNVR